MKRWLGLLLLFTTLALRTWAGDSSLLAARQAQALLGPEVWSRIIRVENTGSVTRYPRALHALIFEVAGMLWFYTDREGTQNFSTQRGHVAEDHGNFTPLLQAIHPGFTRWSTVTPPRLAPADQRVHPRNACFVESLAELRRRVLAGTEILHPRILCSFATPVGPRSGHAVLAYETVRGIEVVDPAWPRHPTRLPRETGQTAAALSQALGNAEPQRARWVAVSDYPTTLLAFQRNNRHSDTAQIPALVAPTPSAAAGAG